MISLKWCLLSLGLACLACLALFFYCACVVAKRSDGGNKK